MKNSIGKSSILWADNVLISRGCLHWLSCNDSKQPVTKICISTKLSRISKQKVKKALLSTFKLVKKNNGSTSNDEIMNSFEQNNIVLLNLLHFLRYQ